MVLEVLEVMVCVCVGGVVVGMRVVSVVVDVVEVTHDGWYWYTFF